MQIRSFDIDSRLASALMQRIRLVHLPIHLQRGIPFVSENDNQMETIQIECADDYPFNEVLSDIINQEFNLSKGE